MIELSVFTWFEPDGLFEDPAEISRIVIPDLFGDHDHRFPCLSHEPLGLFTSELNHIVAESDPCFSFKQCAEISRTYGYYISYFLQCRIFGKMPLQIFFCIPYRCLACLPTQCKQPSEIINNRIFELLNQARFCCRAIGDSVNIFTELPDNILPSVRSCLKV